MIFASADPADPHSTTTPSPKVNRTVRALVPLMLSTARRHEFGMLSATANAAAARAVLGI